MSNNPIKYTDPTGHTEAVTSEGAGTYRCDLDCWRAQQEDKGSSWLDALKHAFYHDPALGGSSSGCNTWILSNGTDYCHHNIYKAPVCPYGCSTILQERYARRFQYPFQMPWQPIDPNAYQTDGYVMGGDFLTDNYALSEWFRDKGAVWVETDGPKMSNFTKDTHVFHEGNITRTLVDGYIVTEGQGTNSTLAVAITNQYIGPVAFKLFVDGPMISYSIADRHLGGSLELLASMIYE